jgi:hypothetical protein
MFEELGYFKEYFIGNKSIGTLPCEKEREVMGYTGRVSEMLKNEIVLSNGKKIKAGTTVISVIYPLCGKIIKPKN